MAFFDQYPRFYQTSQTSPFPDRLNARHAAIIASNAAHLAGARVLDIASHDGRWSFAALKAGAAQVIGIEPRSELIEAANASFGEYGIGSGAYEWRCADVMNALDGGITVDVVLCLGFYYHTIRQAELLDRIERSGARLVVIDTEITAPADAPPPVDSADPRLVFGNPNILQLFSEPVADQQMACADALTRNGRTLVARPSRAAITFMAEHFGYQVSEFDWPGYLRLHPRHAASMVDYAEGWRSTFYLER